MCKNVDDEIKEKIYEEVKILIDKYEEYIQNYKEKVTYIEKIESLQSKHDKLSIFIKTTSKYLSFLADLIEENEIRDFFNKFYKNYYSYYQKEYSYDKISSKLNDIKQQLEEPIYCDDIYEIILDEKDKELRAQYIQEQLDLLRDNTIGDYSIARKSLKELRGGYE